MKNDLKRIVAILIAIAMVMTNVLTAFADVCVEDIVDDVEEITTYESEPEIDEDILEENIDDEVVVDGEEGELKEDEIEDEIAYEDETESDEEIEDESINEENIEEPEYDEEIEAESIKDESFEEPEYNEEIDCDDEKTDAEEIEIKEESENKEESNEIASEIEMCEDIDVGLIENGEENNQDLHLLTEDPNYRIVMYEVHYVNGRSTPLGEPARLYIYRLSEVEGADLDADGASAWYWDSNCTQLIGNNPIVFTRSMITSDCNVYVKFIDDVRKVSFDANGGTGTVPNAIYVPIEPSNYHDARFGFFSDSTCNQSVSSVGTVSKRGYVFNGWGFDKGDYFHTIAYISDKDGNITSFNAQINGDITVKADFSLKTSTITLDRQSATSGGLSKLYSTYTKGISTSNNANGPFIAKLTSTQIPTKTNYTFGGYYTEPEGEGTQYISEDGTISFPYNDIVEDTTLYAFWDAIKYDVTFNTNGGNDIDTAKVNQGSKITPPTTPTKTGYDFKYWYTTDENVEFDFENTTVTGNVTLNAKWEIHKYNIKFNTDGGTEIDDTTVEYNKILAKPNAPTKEGYKFVNWYNDSSFGTEFDFNTPIVEDKILYAKYIPAYILSFDTKGGSSIGDQLIEENASPTRPSNPSRSGYKFVDWYEVKIIDEVEQEVVFDFTEAMTENKTIFAKWEALPKSNTQSSSSSRSSSGGSSHQDQIFILDKEAIKKISEGIYKCESVVLFIDNNSNPRFDIVNGNLRLFNNNGLVKNKLFADTSSGKVYAFDENGDILKGWLINGDGTWYYFNEGQDANSGELNKAMPTANGVTFLVDIKTGLTMPNVEFNGIKTDAFGQVLQGINT